MIDINELWLKETAGKVMYARGLDVYLRNKIRSLEVQSEILNEEEALNIKAVAQSSYGLDNYDVEIIIGKTSGKFGFNCDCDHSGSSSNLCKHVVAVLLKWSREKDTILRKQNRATSRRTEQFIEYFKNSMMNKEKAAYTELNLEVKYELDSKVEKKSSIELKVGLERTYVVRSMKDFLYAIDKKSTEINYGKSFTFNPLAQSFKNEDKQLIELLMEVYEMDSLISGDKSMPRYFGAPAGVISGKKIFLTDLHVKRFLNIMENKSFEATINGVNKNNIWIIHENMPLEFDIKLNNSSLIINHDKELPVPLIEGGNYFFYKDYIYHVSDEQARIYLPFYHEISNSRTRSMSFNKEELGKIASYILPNLKSISKNVRIDKALENKFYEEALRPMIYLDKAEEGINADIIFKYGELELNPFNEKVEDSSKKILVRDINKELQLVSILEAAGFVKTKSNYHLSSEEALVDFLADGINRLQELSEVYYSEALKILKYIALQI